MGLMGRLATGKLLLRADVVMVVFFGPFVDAFLRGELDFPHEIPHHDVNDTGYVGFGFGKFEDKDGGDYFDDDAGASFAPCAC